MRADLHTHTVFCDGKNTPEEMVQAAIAKGLDCIGFSGHSYTFFDERYCMTKEGTAAYRREVAAARERHRGEILVLCGVEQDFWSEEPVEGYDHVIGSVHYVRKDGLFLPVDESAEAQRKAVEEHFGGDWYAFAEAYYELVAGVAQQTDADIIGHFDLITKFNEKNAFFDEEHPRYRAAWQKAADRLLASQLPFEINTGAVSRGYRSAPYPAPEIITYLRERGATLIWSSDSHIADTLCSGFPDDAPDPMPYLRRLNV